MAASLPQEDEDSMTSAQSRDRQRLRASAAPLKLLMIGLHLALPPPGGLYIESVASAHIVHIAHADGEPIPKIDHADEDGEIGDLLVGKMLPQLFVVRIRRTRVCDIGERLGPGQCGAFGLRIEGDSRHASRR
jgi:hypothetical protein